MVVAETQTQQQTAARTPSLEEMVQRATTLAPRLRERAVETESLRHAPDATIQDFQQAGLFKVLQPARYGGFELDYGRTQTDLNLVLGQACGSSAWVQCVVACHAWLLGMFPPAAQEAVWGKDPDTLIASAFAFKTGHGRPVEGGYFIEGDWQFSSGSNACQWIILGTPVEQPDGSRKNLWCLVGPGNWQVLDTWRAAGLKGSGSNDIRVPGAFIPAEHTLDTSLLDGRPSPGSVINPSPIYRLPLAGFFYFNVTTPALGIARGAVEAYCEQLAARPERANQPGRQLRLAESSAEVDAAEGLVRLDLAIIERHLHHGEPLPAGFSARLGRDLSYMVKLCAQAVERLSTAVGAHGIDEDNPINRALRDVHAVANHGVNNWENQALGYARSVLGLPPTGGR